MDELAELRAFRADVAAAPPQARAEARRRLLRVPVPRRQHRTRRRALLATAAVAAAGGASVAIVSGLDEGHVAPVPATAAEVLRHAADTAEQAKGPGVPDDDQYFYVASEGTEMTSTFPTSDPADGFSYLYTKRREIWLSVDRAGRLSESPTGPHRWLTPKDRSNWIAAGRPDTGDSRSSDEPMDPIGQYVIGDEKFTTQQLRDYDPTPQELFDRLRARVGDRGVSPDGEVFVEIADALREAPQTPRLRATLYRALALVPGVQLLGNVHDRLGRAAIGVAYPQRNGLRQELLFDPQTAEILNERQVVFRAVRGLHAPVGTAIEDIVYTKRAVTDATTAP